MTQQATLPRPEYPRPDFVRPEWINLNGQWQFEIDHGKSGKERGYPVNEHNLLGTITVPFCPESRLSGVEYKDFMAAVWYKGSLPCRRTGQMAELSFILAPLIIWRRSG